MYAFVSQAQEVKVYEPANFGGKGNSFEASIKFPHAMAKSGEDRTLIINCDASISRTGRFLSNYCFQNDPKFFPYVVAINRAAIAGKIEPAKIDGIAQIVWFQYFVAFTKKGNKTLIEVFPNSGLQAEKFGFEYTSAQRYKEDSGNFASGCGAAYNKTILVKAIIGKDGKTKNVAVEGKDLSDTCVENLKRDFSEQEFIPAIFEGKPIDSFYSEDIFNRFRAERIK